jgi:hypothetical protein
VLKAAAKVCQTSGPGVAAECVETAGVDRTHTDAIREVTSGAGMSRPLTRSGASALTIGAAISGVDQMFTAESRRRNETPNGLGGLIDGCVGQNRQA